MATVKILSVDNNPITKIGSMAGICYGTTNEKRYYNIGLRCLRENHGRVQEFTDITLEISDISAKLGRELYTHIVGTSRLQESTRYIDYSKGFGYIIPHTVKNNKEALTTWDSTMEKIYKSMSELKELGIPLEDYTNLLPLAYSTKIVIKISLRALIHMFHVRACTCAYWEFRELMNNIKKALSQIDDEWGIIANEFFVPKCIAMGYCEEKMRHCGIRPLKSDVVKE